MKATRRFEYKYIISYADYYNVIDIIRTMLNHDKHGEDDDYPVTSVYLDDIVFSGAADKAFGNQFHKKYRVRYYHDSSVKKLELKEKTGDISEKFSTSISEDIYQGILNHDLDKIRIGMEDQLIRKFMLDMSLHYITPKAVISYKREAYKSDLDDLRITFDHSLCGQRYDDDFSYHFEDVDFKLLQSGFLILEVKFEHYLPGSLKTILNKMNLNQISYSKYFMGFNSLEL